MPLLAGVLDGRHNIAPLLLEVGGGGRLAVRRRHLLSQAKEAGGMVGRYAACLLDSPLPWTNMRHVYRLLGLVRRYGGAPVDQACGRALEIDVIDVTRITRMVEQAIEGSQPEQVAAPPGGTLRFLRAPTEYQRPFKGGDDA